MFVLGCRNYINKHVYVFCINDFLMSMVCYDTLFVHCIPGKAERHLTDHTTHSTH